MKQAIGKFIGIAAVLAAGCAIQASTAFAARMEPLPKELEGVGITEHLDGQIPLDLEFADERGKPVHLKDYFDGKRPVLLTLNYYGCPMLCGLQLNGLLEGLKELSWTPGKEFEIVTVSFDPNETPILAKVKKQNYMNEYGRPEAAKGWHFLTGHEKEIKALTDAAGFGYKYNEERGEYMHTAALFILKPDGRISRYLYGITYEASPLRLSLVEAADGKVGTTIDQLILFCYHYSASEGRYALAAANVMRLGGAATLLVVAGFLFTFWRREWGRVIPPVEGQQT
jgi:protein SCO1/2